MKSVSESAVQFKFIKRFGGEIKVWFVRAGIKPALVFVENCMFI